MRNSARYQARANNEGISVIGLAQKTLVKGASFVYSLSPALRGGNSDRDAYSTIDNLRVIGT